jgi:hypothetical protein
MEETPMNPDDETEANNEQPNETEANNEQPDETEANNEQPDETEANNEQPNETGKNKQNYSRGKSPRIFLKERNQRREKVSAHEKVTRRKKVTLREKVSANKKVPEVEEESYRGLDEYGCGHPYEENEETPMETARDVGDEIEKIGRNLENERNAEIEENTRNEMRLMREYAENELGRECIEEETIRTLQMFSQTDLSDEEARDRIRYNEIKYDENRGSSPRVFSESEQPEEITDETQPEEGTQRRQPKRDSQAKSWCFTINNPTEEEKQYIVALARNIEIEMMIVGIEKGDLKETPHLQGYVEFAKRHRFGAVKRIL